MPGSQSAPNVRARDLSARELDLISGAQRGDISAFNQLVRAHQEIAYRFAFHVLDDANAAERVTQSAFELLYRQIKHWNGDAFKVWLLRTLVQQCKRAAGVRLQTRAAFGQSPVEMGLAMLSTDERIVCVLADVLGLNEDEIEGITSTPLSALRATRSRARRQIRDMLLIHGAAAREPAMLA